MSRMSRTGRMRRWLLVLMLLLGTGCSVPDHSGVHTTTLAGRGAADDVIPYSPRGPSPGASPGQIVDGFIEAMKATPIDTTYAKKYLTAAAAASWDPSRRTIVYRELGSHQSSSNVNLPVEGANWLDDRGAWRGPLGAASSVLHFTLTHVHGAWRISSAPDAMVVAETWFQSHFTRSLVYYFDPTARTLVPEPMFAPKGAQYASTLINSLLGGPGESERGVVRTFLPERAGEVLSVPVRDGVADIDLHGDIGLPTIQAQQLMAAQLAWTLRQDHAVDRIRLTLNGTPVTFPDSGATFGVNNTGPVFDPNGYASSDDLYALHNTALNVRDDDGRFVPVRGAWAQPHHVTEIAVDPSGTRAAALTSDRHSVMVGPLRTSGTVAMAPVTGSHLLRPSWDLAGRLWLVDATASGAKIMYLDGDRVVPVAVPGVTGENVRRLLVSRDGTRLIALIGDSGSDRIVESRLRSSTAGVVTSATGATELAHPEVSTQIADIAWTSPTTIVAAQELASNAILSPLSVDGATMGLTTQSSTVSVPITGLVGSPVTSARLYVRSGTSLVDPLGTETISFVKGFGTVAYEG